MRVKTLPDVNTRKKDGLVHPGLSPMKEYHVVGIYIDPDEKMYCIVDNNLEPILYPSDLFVTCVDQVPPHWVKTDLGDGCYSLDPPEFAEPKYFHEDFFDGVEYAVKRFQRYLKLNGIIP